MLSLGRLDRVAGRHGAESEGVRGALQLAAFRSRARQDFARSAEERVAAGRFAEGSLERRAIHSAGAGGALLKRAGHAGRGSLVGGWGERCAWCLQGRPRPFRMRPRSRGGGGPLAAGAVEPHATACLEFVPGAGLWAVVWFADGGQLERWRGRWKRRSGCWPIPASAASARAAGAGRRRRNSLDGTLPDLILPPRATRPRHRPSGRRGAWTRASQASLLTPTGCCPCQLAGECHQTGSEALRASMARRGASKVLSGQGAS